jgi:uncharacterized protein
MRFEWDETKNQRNLAKHKVRFETAALVFNDAYSLTQGDETTDEEERWITLDYAGIDRTGCRTSRRSHVL